MSIDLKDDILKAVLESKFIKNKCKTPKFRKPTPPPNPNCDWQPTNPTSTKPPKTPTSGSNAVKPNPNYVPPASVKHQRNKAMYGLKLHIPFEDLDTYIHDHIEVAHKNHTFIPVKVEVNEIDLGIEISLVSAVPNEIYGCRYKLDLKKLPKENEYEKE